MSRTPTPISEQVAQLAPSIKTKRTVNRPHWKDLCEDLTKRLEKADKELERLRANGADSTDIAKIKAESFAAGVAAASAHFSK